MWSWRANNSFSQTPRTLVVVWASGLMEGSASSRLELIDPAATACWKPRGPLGAYSIGPRSGVS